MQSRKRDFLKYLGFHTAATTFIMNEQHGKLNEKAEPQQPRKVLRWVKASERLPKYSGSPENHYRVDGNHKVHGNFHYSIDDERCEGEIVFTVIGMGLFKDYVITKEKFHALEWLEETEDLSAPVSPVEEKQKWIISGEKTTQVSEDSWRRNTKTLVVTESTPLVKALQWAEDNGLDF